MKGIENWNSAHHRRMARICISLVILMLVAYTLVCYVIIDNYSVMPREAMAEEVYHTSHLIASDKAILPVPDAGASVDWGCGTYYSNISEAGMQDFLSNLDKAGWKDLQGRNMVTEVKPGSICYDLRNGDHVLQMITFLSDAEHAVCNSILVYYNENYSMEKMSHRVGALQKAEAMPLIQAQVEILSKKGELPESRYQIAGLFEIPIANAYEKMQVQAYSAISDMGLAGCFLVRGGIASYIPGTLDSDQVADIDGDGSYELLNISDSWEANTYCLELEAYDYGSADPTDQQSGIPVVKYKARYVPKNGYEQFSLVKDGNDNVVLTGEAGIYGIVSAVDGSLSIRGEKTPELISWANSFDQSKLLLIKKKIPKQPPEISVSIGTIPVEYLTQKTDWNGEKELLPSSKILKQLGEKQGSIPTIEVYPFMEEERQQRISIDFGESMPDSIQVHDTMLDDSGSPRYNIDTEQAVQIMSDSRVEFPLTQHMAYYLSSDSKDYERDWKRLFRVTCTWGKKQCTYDFVINTSDLGSF